MALCNATSRLKEPLKSKRIGLPSLQCIQCLQETQERYENAARAFIDNFKNEFKDGL